MVCGIGGKAVGHLVIDSQDAELGAILPIFPFVFGFKLANLFTKYEIWTYLQKWVWPKQSTIKLIRHDSFNCFIFDGDEAFHKRAVVAN